MSNTNTPAATEFGDTLVEVFDSSGEVVGEARVADVAASLLAQRDAGVSAEFTAMVTEMTDNIAANAPEGSSAYGLLMVLFKDQDRARISPRGAQSLFVLSDYCIRVNTTRSGAAYTILAVQDGEQAIIDEVTGEVAQDSEGNDFQPRKLWKLVGYRKFATTDAEANRRSAILWARDLWKAGKVVEQFMEMGFGVDGESMDELDAQL